MTTSNPAITCHYTYLTEVELTLEIGDLSRSFVFFCLERAGQRDNEFWGLRQGAGHNFFFCFNRGNAEEIIERAINYIWSNLQELYDERYNT